MLEVLEGAFVHMTATVPHRELCAFWDVTALSCKVNSSRALEAWNTWESRMEYVFAIEPLQVVVFTLLVVLALPYHLRDILLYAITCVI